MSIDLDGYMKDSKGRLVPVEQVSEYDRLMDQFVRENVQNARAQRNNLMQFKQRAFDDCYAFLDMLAERYQRAPGGKKGNITFSTFDGSEAIRIKVQDSLAFGPELQVAKEIIDECISEWAQGANENLRAIVLDAFEVDKEGKLSVTRILSLRRIKIQDERWIKAMDIIADSLRINVSKTYINFLEKDSSGKLVNISLDIAAI